MDIPSPPCPRILLTARDPSTAEAMRVLGKAMVEDGRIEVCLATQEPASGLLRDAPEIADRRVLVPESARKEDLVSLAGELLAHVAPDIVLTGVSGPDFGIDEAVLSVAPRGDFGPYALQSYWGDVNEAFSTAARTYLVMDDFAARLTEARTGERAVVVGSLKHSRYGRLDVQQMRRDFRDCLGVNDGTCVIGLFGQPFGPDHPYQRTIAAFAEAVGRGAPAGTIILYRPHPKELPAQAERVRSLFFGYALDFRLDERNPAEHALCGCDYVVSAFSTCGYDLQQLLRVSKIPLGVPVYLMFGQEFVSWFREYTRLDEVPMSDRGMAVVAGAPSELPRILDPQAMEKNRRTCWESIARHFPGNGGSVAEVIEMLIANYREECHIC